VIGPEIRVFQQYWSGAVVRMTNNADGADGGVAAHPRARGIDKGSKVALVLLAPCTAFLLVLFVFPIAYVLVLSVTAPKLSLVHFERIASVPLYSRVLWNTFLTSAIVTVACLLMGYPLAYVMARRNDLLAMLLLGTVAVSFWTGFLVRTYAWLVILGNKGPVAALYTVLGGSAPPQLLFTSFSSTLGITHIMLPFMVLALYSVMRKIDPNHLRAAHSLGARPFTAFRAVYLPLSLPGVVSGSILVFTISLGFYITPILLGTPKDMMISQLINQQIEDLLNWGFASALAVVLLAATVVVLAVYNRFVGLDRLWG
jgi:putative spermidine/putrescine transport system permease protein